MLNSSLLRGGLNLRCRLANPLNLIRIIPAEGTGLGSSCDPAVRSRPLEEHTLKQSIHSSPVTTRSSATRPGQGKLLRPTQSRSRKRSEPQFCLVLAGAFAGAPAWSQAANDLEEVVVTATLMPETSTSVSASVISERTQALRGAAHLEDVITRVPNVSSSSGASRNRFFQIRGIGERSQFVEPVNPSVGILLDGIDLSGIGGR